MSRPEVTQAPDVRVEKDAMDAIVCDGEQERCEWCVLVVEDERRLAIELSPASSLTVLCGDARLPESIAAVLPGHDAVLSAIGPHLRDAAPEHAAQ